jgi:hypothetical protein
VTERDGEGESFARERRKYLPFNEVREDKGDGERGAHGRQVAVVGQQRRCEVAGGGRATVASPRALAGTRCHGPFPIELGSALLKWAGRSQRASSFNLFLL